MGLTSWFYKGIERSDGFVSGGPAISFDEYLSYFTYNAHQYPIGLNFSSAPRQEEEIIPNFSGLVAEAYSSSGPIFACIVARATLLSEARFLWREFRKGRPGQLFGDTSLAPLERPWPNAQTGDLVVRLDQDYVLSGNFYGVRLRDNVFRMRPDWVTIVLGSQFSVDDPASAIDAVPVGYVYHPGGKTGGQEPIVLPVEAVCHFSGPTPDPLARFRGMSPIAPIIRDVQADKQATSHKINFLQTGGPKTAISVDIPDIDEFNDYVAAYKANAEGSMQAYSTLFFNSGAPPNVTTIGSDLVQTDTKSVQGAGETRIAAALRVPPIIAGFSEGLDASTYSNYELAFKHFVNGTIRPSWRMMAACFEAILDKPQTASQLWYDERDIAALREDSEKRAKVQSMQASAAKTAFDAGFSAESIIDWLNTDDITVLEHTGVESVQTQGNGAGGEIGAAEGTPENALPPVARSFSDELEEMIEEAV